MADEDVKIVIKQKGTIPVFTKTKVGVTEVYHDESLEGKGTVGDPLKVSEKIIVDIDSRVEKTSEADKVYGTDAQGNQTTYDVDGFGKVDDVLVNGTSVVTNKIAEVEVPTAVSELTNDADYQSGSQVSNTVSSAINTHNTSNNAHSNLLTPITQDIDAIEEKIPAEASSSNQLADKDYVDSQIGDLNEWTTAQYTPTTTNFVVGNTYTVEEAFQRTASLFAGQQGEIDDIEAVIPAQATAQNQLADKNFVNATVATNSANFRGNWATWTDVPTQANLYPEDYVGNKTPTNNDYMVVDDASDYVSPTGLSHEISAVNLHPTKTVTIRITDEYGSSSEYYYNDGFLNTWKAISEYYSLFYVGGAPGYWYIKTNEPTETNIVINGTVYPVNPSGTTSSAGALLCATNYSTDPVSAGIPASAGQYQGSWRFIYIGTWATDGKYGWNPVYRIGTAFTQEQQAAIDSGITATMVDNYVDPNSTAATAYNARITAVETDKRDIINSANKVYATDANGANKNDLVYSISATADTIAQRGTNGVLKVGTPVDNSDAATKKYVDDGLSTKVDKVNTANKVYGTDAQGNQTTYDKSGFQDKLTAGTNITIDENNVISSTAQESFFRGRFENWSNVPTDPTYYEQDLHNPPSKIPEANDYIVVNDMSDWRPADFDDSFELWNDSKNYQTIWGYKYNNVITTKSIVYNPDSSLKPEDQWFEYFGPHDEVLVRRTGQVVSVIAQTTLRYNGTVYTVGQTLFSESLNGDGCDTTHPHVIEFSNSTERKEGTWRMRYQGVWDTDGKNGWKPEYQIENVLPIATDTEQGITKLYTDLGENTDGAVDQATVTTELGKKQDLLTNASNAGEGIIIDDVTQEISTNNIVWRYW